MTRVHDITLALRPGMPTYPGEPGPSLKPLKQISKGDSANVTALYVGAHTGTHVDAPHHFIDGAPAIESLPLQALVGECDVVDMGERKVITAADLEAAQPPISAARVLLKTRNSGFWQDDTFHEDFSHITPDAARWLVERGTLLAGIDYLSIERFHSPTHEVHQTLLRAGIVILEGLDLRKVEAGRYLLVCAPLKLVGGDGAPARVFLLEDTP
ncbi:MAG TPA: cyclase family protein [Dehalococcoidia bacterium]|nr:cyclase family protein [Dehalococcoidia bacterium]